jgi:23S rRNA (guanosine2251-2'-O)-methyltransferase
MTTDVGYPGPIGQRQMLDENFWFLPPVTILPGTFLINILPGVLSFGQGEGEEENQKEYFHTHKTADALVQLPSSYDLTIATSILSMNKLQLEQLGRISIDEFKRAPKIPITIVLDNVRSLHNVGSVFRTADAFRCERIFLTGITGTPPHREIHKTALGATESVQWEFADKPEKVVSELKRVGYRIVVVEQTTESTPLHQFIVKPGDRICLIFGNEIKGVSNEVIALADEALEIPQSGTKHSLNISVCVGIVCWELARKLE